MLLVLLVIVWGAFLVLLLWWKNINVVECVRRFYGWISQRRKYILVVIAWAACFALITHKIMFGRVGEYWVHVTSTDLALILVLSIFAGAFLAEVERVFFGYIGAMILSVVTLVFIRTIRDFQIWGDMYPDVWSWLLARALGTVFSNLFIAILLSFLGVYVGAILADVIRRS